MLLLDTNAAIYVAHEEPMRAEARASIEAAEANGGLLVSVISAWEIGLLVSKERLDLTLSPSVWFERFLERSGVRLVPLSLEAAILSSFLPPPFHGDPADRMLVATARHLTIPLVTRDTRILAYGEAGHLATLAC